MSEVGADDAMKKVLIFRSLPAFTVLLSVAFAVMKSEVVAEASDGSFRPVAGGISASTLPETLLQHFRDRGILLRREAGDGGQKAEWIRENAEVGPRCEVVTGFVRFPSGAGVEAMRN